MEKQFNNTTGVECPVCHNSLRSKRHVSGCGTQTAREVEEVVPPERRRRQLRCGHEEVEPSAFPLVSAAHDDGLERVPHAQRLGDDRVRILTAGGAC